MTERPIVTPQKSSAWLDDDRTRAAWVDGYTEGHADALATEPDRTRAAVVKALRAEARYFRVHLGADGLDPEVRRLESRADAIENGADY